jgi:hypothetical protein
MTLRYKQNEKTGAEDESLPQISKVKRFFIVLWHCTLLAFVYPIGLIVLWRAKDNVHDLTSKIVLTLLSSWQFIHSGIPNTVKLVRALSANSQAPVVMHVAEEDLYQEYKTNPTATNKKYDGQQIEMTGFVVEYDGSGVKDQKDPWVALDIGTKDTFVACYFKPSDQTTLKTLHFGERVAIQGVGQTIDNSPYAIFGLDDCKLISR